jgi:uncharacterized HAD superfamily protein
LSLKPLVGIDLDGVLADFNSRFLRVSRRLLSKPEKGFQPTDFYYEKCGPWTKKEVERVINWMKNEDDFWLSLERLPNTNQLAKREPQLEYFFITSRFSTIGLPTTYQSEMWLKQQYGLKAPFVIVSSEKGKEAAKLDLTHFIDDRAENCVEVKDAVPGCQVAVFDTTYNRHLKDPRILRVTDFNQWLKGVS